MSELSMLKTLELWDKAVSLTERGLYEDALMKFMSLEQLTADPNQTLITSARNLFNIGQTYFSLGRIDMAIKAFQESIGKDKMLTIAHFMLGCAHLKKGLNGKALQDFENAYFFLRGNRLIDYKQLGLKYKLYLCEILCNKAIAEANLGKDYQAKCDFLKAVESRVEPRHGVIQDALLCWQRGKKVEPVVPSIVVFQPSKSKLQVTKEKADYLGKSQVVAARVEDAKKNGERANGEQSYIEGESHRPDALNLLNERSSLMKDLRKKDTRKSLKKTPGAPVKPTTLKPDSARVPPPRPTSPRPEIRLLGSAGGSELGVPPTKPLPPAPRSKSPVPIHRRPLPPSPNSFIAREPPSPMRPPKRQGRTVTFELVISRSVQVNQDCTLSQMSQAAANALGVSEDILSMWCNHDDKLSPVNEEFLTSLWKTDTRPTIYCREKK